MRKKYLIFILIIVGLIAISFNAYANDLSGKAELEYVRSKLEVKSYEKGIMSYGSGWGSYSSKTSWKAYKGNKEVSEIEFLENAGAESELLEEVKQHHKKRDRNLIGGSITFGVSGLLAVNEGNKTIEEPNQTIGLIGMGGMIVGGYFMVKGYNMSEKYLDINYAKKIADEYNEELKDELSYLPQINISDKDIILSFHKTF